MLRGTPDLTSEVLEGTGKWLLEDEIFQSWKDAEASSILWLHGIPGSGKSKLTSIVVEDALQSSPERTVYFYCSRNPAEPGRSDPTCIVASFARQLAMPQSGGKILDAAVEVYRKFENNAFASKSLTLGQSIELIHRLLNDYKNQEITVIIDALDECNRDTRQDLLDLLLALLKAPTTTKIFVSSRDDRDIVHELERYRNLHLSSERNSGDIDLFVRSETRRLITKGSLLRGSLKKEELRDKIVHELVSNAHGMFRWASLHIQELCRQATDAAIEERLVRMPRTLEGLYREILERVENRDAVADRNLAKNALSWLLCARERLRSGVFLAMVCRTKDGTPPTVSTDQLLILCNDLVLFDDTLDVFRFSHLSVREFLEGHEGYGMTSAHALAAEQCLLNLAGIHSRIMPLTLVLEYSSFFWADHSKSMLDIPSLIELAKIQPKNLNGATHEELVLRHGSIRVLQWHFDAGVPFNLSKKHVKLIAAIEENGEDMLLLLLERFATKIRITQEVVLAAVSNKECGDRILGLLLDRRGHEIYITDEIVRAAVQNPRKAVEITSLLLSERKRQIRITPDIVTAAIQNPCRGQIHITEDFIIGIASTEACSMDVMELLLDECEEDMQITRGLVDAVEDHLGDRDEVMGLLIDRLGAKSQISDLALETMMGKFNAATVRKFIEMNGNVVKVTSEMVKAAVRNVLHAEEMMAMLLSEYGDDIRITKDIIEAVFENEYRGYMIMGLLLDERTSEIQITEEFVKAAVQSEPDMLELILDKRGDEISITDDIIESCSTGEMITIIMEKTRHKIEITEKILIRAAKQNNLLWGQDGGLLQLLLDTRLEEVRITEDIVSAATGNEFNGLRFIKLLLDQCGDDIVITKQILIAAASNTESGDQIMALLLITRGGSIRITQTVVEAAVRNSPIGHRVMAVLFEGRSDGVPVTERIFLLAVKNGSSGDKIVEMLLDNVKDNVQITEEIVSVAVQNRSCGSRIMEILLEKFEEDVPTTNETIRLAADNWGCGDKIIELLLERN
ncbi:ankyrin repeat protein [Colletotrichum kahawae]|uniref:Ankyrin repeat protein n=1 Tax=Colletotrichum kahawae TaxID=34407 RepID=A0AAD9YLG7_COLKA|nr:ankyrin repeat protein [Colletotrichum kahawae]